MTLEISRLDWLKGLRNFIGFRGHTSFDLSEDVLPVLDLSRIEPPFHSAVGGLAGGTQGAVAGQFTYVGLYMASAGTPKSRRAVAKAIYLSAPGVAAMQPMFVGVLNEIAAAAVAFTSAGALGSWDSVPNPAIAADVILPTVRYISANSATQLLNGGNSLSVAASGETGAGSPTWIDRPFVLAPGAMLLVQTAAVNQQARAGFIVDEYDIG